MALAERYLRKRPKPLLGHPKPRIGPPVPARSDVAAFRTVAEEMGITLMPWQETAGRYLTAHGADGRLLYREVCILVARQNGKTTLMKPLIVKALRQGKRVMHIAQNRELPRIMFGVIADAMSDQPDLFPKRRGRTIWPRYGSGQEEITLVNGGTYRIAAASRGGARGHPNDLLIFDELREMESFEVIAAAEPTLTMSEDPQTVYLSNEGTEQSVVLNAIRDRADDDPSLAFLAWSTSSEREADDKEGWLESNPAIGHYPSVLRTLEAAYRRHKLANTLSIFETEHLCRRVITLRQSVVDGATWSLRQGELQPAKRPAFAFSVDPDGNRATLAQAWQQTDGKVALRIVEDITSGPIDVEALGKRWKTLALRAGSAPPGFDPWTDGEVAKHFREPKAITGRDYANASVSFANLVDSDKLVWSDAEPVSDDLSWTARKPHESGAWMAVRAKEDRPTTAVFAAIRAVWLASGPRVAAPAVY